MAQKQRYLLVLEEVTDVAAWNAVRKFLPDWNNGSRIIMTTVHTGICLLCPGQPYLVSELRRIFGALNVEILDCKVQETENDENSERQFRGHLSFPAISSSSSRLGIRGGSSCQFNSTSPALLLIQMQNTSPSPEARGRTTTTPAAATSSVPFVSLFKSRAGCLFPQLRQPLQLGSVAVFPSYPAAVSFFLPVDLRGRGHNQKLSRSPCSLWRGAPSATVHGPLGFGAGGGLSQAEDLLHQVPAHSCVILGTADRDAASCHGALPGITQRRAWHAVDSRGV
ncbi:hypothetical protein EJB05_47277, partial [Eragrostis curvula]